MYKSHTSCPHRISPKTHITIPCRSQLLDPCISACRMHSGTARKADQQSKWANVNRIVRRSRGSAQGEATVNELAEPFEITKQAISKHIQVLEQAGLVTRSRDAQRRPVHLNAAQLEALTAWIDRYRLIHEQQYRNLDALLARSATDRKDLQ